jgi:glycosyltransferase involved in cell wall biosynthesis
MSSCARILILNERDPLHPAAGGVEVHVAEVSRRMAEMGYEITLASSGFAGGLERERVSGMDVHRLGTLATYYPRACWMCARETRRGRFDLVVEHLCKVPFCAAAYSAAPVLAVNHHLFGSSAFMQVSWPIAAAVVAIEQLIPFVYRKLPFLAVSPSSRDDLVARGIPAEQIGEIYNGIELPTLEVTPWAQRPLRVSYFGRIEPYKRVDLFLRASALLTPRFPELEIAVIGRGKVLDPLRRLAAQLGIAERTRFPGFVSDAERDRLLGETRVGVCPSVKEGWGITVVEANAMGVPVVATDAPGLRDAVREGETGLLVPDGGPEIFVEGLAQAMGRLLDDEPLAVRLSTGAVEWSRRFTWDRAAQDMARAVDAAVESS